MLMNKTGEARKDIQMKKQILAALAAAGILSSATSAWANSVVVTEKNSHFTSTSLDIKIGDTVQFRNEDTIYHDVFSLSDNATFDLGSYGPGEIRTVKFNKPGKVLVECAIHRGEKMTLQVK